MGHRTPSYSDSFIILKDSSIDLAPLVLPRSALANANADANAAADANAEEQKPANIIFIGKNMIIFILKTSIHIFFISIFETFFFFSFVSASENTGIINTINTFYEPIKDACPGWPGNIHEVLYEILIQLNISTVDADSTVGRNDRNAYNNGLFTDSQNISIIFLAVVVCLSFIHCVKGIRVPWTEIIVENVIMVGMLGIYEYLFFKEIIYRYNTLSKPEMNAYILDGLWQCVQNSSVSKN